MTFNLYLFRSFVIVVLISQSLTTMGQTTNNKDDLTIAKNILIEAGITIPNDAKINRNGAELNLNKRKSMKLVRRAVYNTYGWFNILKQKPFHKVRIEGYWVVWGNFKRKGERYGGVFTCIMNPKNGSIEYLIHGK